MNGKRKAILVTVSALLIEGMFLPKHAHSQSIGTDIPSSETLSEEAPDSLRRRKRSIDRELNSLRDRFSKISKALEEINTIEDSVSAKIDKDPDYIRLGSGLSDDIFSKDGGLESFANRDLNEAVMVIDVSPSSLTTPQAKNLYNSLRKLESQSVSVPSECSPARPSEKVDEQEITKFIDACAKAFEKMISGLYSNESQLNKEISKEKIKLGVEVETLPEKISQLQSVRDEIENILDTNDNLSEKITESTIPIVGILLLALLLAPRLYKEHIQAEILSSKLTLELITVYILVTTILILGLANRIENEVLGTLLGGISGYVLGRSLSGKNQNKDLDQWRGDDHLQSSSIQSKGTEAI